MKSSKEIIAHLQLLPHPEGGYYKETYRSEMKMDVGENRIRNIGTAIYYLLENEDRSMFHRLVSDELWFFHQGSVLEIVKIENGKAVTVTLGSQPEKGEQLQAIIPANTWFAARVKNGSGFALVSCTVSPGFDFADFEMANRDDLLQQFPQLKMVIIEFTK